jgi:hypothetical protein
MNTHLWKSQIDVITKELKSRYQYDVIAMTDEEDRADFSDRIVYINSRSHPETRFYTLLHEYGHVELYEEDWRSFGSTFPSYIRFHSKRSTRSKSGKIATIAEEIEAWRRGLSFAYRKVFVVDFAKYEKVMNESLMSYVEWAAGV